MSFYLPHQPIFNFCHTDIHQPLCFFLCDFKCFHTCALSCVTLSQTGTCGLDIHIPIVAGKSFVSEDTHKVLPVVVVSVELTFCHAHSKPQQIFVHAFSPITNDFPSSFLLWLSSLPLLQHDDSVEPSLLPEAFSERF